MKREVMRKEKAFIVFFTVLFPLFWTRELIFPFRTQPHRFWSWLWTVIRLKRNHYHQSWKEKEMCLRKRVSFGSFAQIQALQQLSCWQWVGQDLSCLPSCQQRARDQGRWLTSAVHLPSLLSLGWGLRTDMGHEVNLVIYQRATWGE